MASGHAGAGGGGVSLREEMGVGLSRRVNGRASRSLPEEENWQGWKAAGWLAEGIGAAPSN